MRDFRISHGVGRDDRSLNFVIADVVNGSPVAAGFALPAGMVKTVYS